MIEHHFVAETTLRGPHVPALWKSVFIDADVDASASHTAFPDNAAQTSTNELGGRWLIRREP
jgi:hypothetical protein